MVLFAAYAEGINTMFKQAYGFRDTEYLKHTISTCYFLNFS